MTISLTKEEFIQRLEAKRKIFTIAIGYDLKQFKRPPNSPRYMVQYEGGEIELHEFIGKLVSDSIFRVIDLVYQDSE